MEKEIQEIIDKIKELKGKELGHYIDKLLDENDDRILKNKEVLLAMAERVNGFGYHHRAVRDKFSSIGLSMQDELRMLEREKTKEFIENNPELLELLDIATKWWVEVIRKPYFANYDNKQISLEMRDYFQLDVTEKKVEASNSKKLTPEKEKKFVEALTFEVADAIRRDGYCNLRADTYGFDILAIALEEANLRVSFPKKLSMKITKDSIELASSRGAWDVVYELPKKEENNTKKM